jgi:hypothetical protein
VFLGQCWQQSIQYCVSDPPSFVSYRTDSFFKEILTERNTEGDRGCQRPRPTMRSPKNNSHSVRSAGRRHVMLKSAIHLACQHRASVRHYTCRKHLFVARNCKATSLTRHFLATQHALLNASRTAANDLFVSNNTRYPSKYTVHDPAASAATKFDKVFCCNQSRQLAVRNDVSRTVSVLIRDLCPGLRRQIYHTSHP